MKNALKDSRLLIFDLDGTLLDSKADISASMNRTLSKYGLPGMDADFVWKYLGDGALYLVNRCFAHYGKQAPEDAVDFFLSDYQKNSLKNTGFYPGIEDVLRKLNKRRKAILTNKLHDFTLQILDGLDSTRHFEYILGRKDHKKKPDPEGIHIILGSLGVRPEQSVMIGDTTIDLEAGKRAGTMTLAVTWGVHDRDTLIAAKPDACIEKVSDLTDIFDDPD